MLRKKISRIERIVREELGTSANIALQLGRHFGIEPQFWLNLQNRYDLEDRRHRNRTSLSRIPPHRSRAA